MEPMEIAEALNSSTREALRAARDWRQRSSDRGCDLPYGNRPQCSV